MMNLTGDGNAFSEALDPKRSASWRAAGEEQSRRPNLSSRLVCSKALLISAFLFFLVCESSGTLFSGFLRPLPRIAGPDCAGVGLPS